MEKIGSDGNAEVYQYAYSDSIEEDGEKRLF